MVRLKARFAPLAIAASDPGTLADQAFQRMMYGDHPYGRPTKGDLETIPAITREDVVAFHRAALARGGVADPTGAQLYLAHQQGAHDRPLRRHQLPLRRLRRKPRGAEGRELNQSVPEGSRMMPCEFEA